MVIRVDPFILVSSLPVTLTVGGPDVPPVTKREQGEMIYDVLNTPKDKRTFVSIPLGSRHIARAQLLYIRGNLV